LESLCLHNFILSVYLFYEIVFDILILLFNYVLKCFKIKLEPFRDSY
jgi:hypothetical protein